MKTILTVITSPRRNGASYVEDTCRALDANGAEAVDECWVVADGIGLHDSNLLRPAGWFMCSNAQRTGSRLATWRALTVAIERGADFQIFCEDDLHVSPGAVTRILDHASRWDQMSRNAAWISYYDAKECPEGTTPGLHTIPCMGLDGNGFCGSLCLLIPRRTIEYLVTKCDPIGKSPFDYTFHAGDCMLGWFMSNSPWPNYEVHIPTLIDHRGDVSGVGNRALPVRGNNYIGKRDAVYEALQKPFHEVFGGK